VTAKVALVNPWQGPWLELFFEHDVLPVRSMNDPIWNASNPFRWFTLPTDEEGDMYRLLAYVQRIDAHYRERKLYPYLDELRDRLDQMKELRRRRDELSASMPRDITGVDLRKGELVRATVREDELLRAIDAMVAQTLPELSNALERGVDLRAQLAATIRFEPVGLLPLYTREGYLLIHHGRAARAYAYAMTLPMFGTGMSARHVLRTRYVADYTIGLTCTYEHVKADLVRSHAHLPNPAVFAFSSEVPLPAIETFVPLAKQLVYEVVGRRGT
jgi:hypothetical protein